MADVQFYLAPSVVAAISEAVRRLGADLDRLHAEFDRQLPAWRYGPQGTEVSSWLDLMQNLYAVMEDAEHSPGRGLGLVGQTGKEPPATGKVTGGSSSRCVDEG